MRIPELLHGRATSDRKADSAPGLKSRTHWVWTMTKEMLRHYQRV